MLNLEPAQRRDFVLVGGYTALLFALVLCVGGPLTMHEGVLSQTTRAMLSNHDWLVPRYGDAPWIERPPLPQWISCTLCAVVGHDHAEWNMRIGSALSGLLTVLLTVWLASRLLGRWIGILSGLILATMYEFLRYSTLAEADIFLAPIVAAALGVFAYLEILRAPAEDENRHFFGRRPWPVLGFFVLLGMTNLAKGLVFGTVIVAAPVGIYLLWNFRWQRLTRYLWLWGWLAFFAIALPWPLLVLQRYPAAVEVWRFDLFGRLNNNYLAQPAWYYLECLLWVPQPWSIAGFAGLGLTFRKAWQERSPVERLLWCWAWTPLLVFSLSQGKHHHYMVHYLAPWAILSAQAGVWTWRKLAEPWQKRWVIPVAVAVVGEVFLWLTSSKLTGPDWTLPVLLTLVPPFILAAWWFGLHQRPAVALGGSFALMFVLYSAFFAYKGAYLHRSKEDTVFLHEVRRMIPLDQPLMIHSADEALEGLRMQFYMGDTVYFLHNLSYVRDDRIVVPDIYVVTRYNRKNELEKYGQVERLLTCKHSRREKGEEERWTLFHVRLRDGLERKKTSVPISPMQAMYREPGPDLDRN